MSSEDIILCEGFYDRAFLAGWLKTHGCVEQRRDPWNKQVTAGQFGFTNPAGRFVRTRPCHGVTEIPDVLHDQLVNSATEHKRRIVVCRDLDAQDSANIAVEVQHILQGIEQRVSSNGFGVVRAGADLVVGAGQTTIVSLMCWSSADPPDPELPVKQVLERLICASIREAYAVRSQLVHRWLSSIHSIPADPKQYSWSHMAGWYPERGCDDFFGALWEDGLITSALERRLQATGALNVLRATLT